MQVFELSRRLSGASSSVQIETIRARAVAQCANTDSQASFTCRANTLISNSIFM